MKALSDSQAKMMDAEQIDMLVETGGEAAGELMEELLELFTSECESKMHEITGALAAGLGAADQASKQAHAIAGSSANIGAKQLWRVAKQLESQCKDGSMAAAAATFEQLKADYITTVEILRHIVSDLVET